MFIGLKNLDQLDRADPGKEGTYKFFSCLKL